MRDLAARLAGLPPDRRRALEQLLAARSISPSRAADLPAIASGASVQAAGDHARRFYDEVNHRLNATDAGRFARFLNYGYIPDGTSDRAVVELPRHTLDKSSVQLVLELVADCELADRTILDVGCGRGGLVETLATHFAPRRVIGLDQCWGAVAFASTMSVRHVTFAQGDAQALPFAAGAVDVITNLESSHSYPSASAFYAEVARVLRVGGYFLYSDALPALDVGARVEQLNRLGLTAEIERDITSNVLRACEASASRRLATFGGDATTGVLRDFLGVPASAPFEALRSGEWKYVMYRFAKRPPGGDAGNGQ